MSLSRRSAYSSFSISEKPPKDLLSLQELSEVAVVDVLQKRFYCGDESSSDGSSSNGTAIQQFQQAQQSQREQPNDYEQMLGSATPYTCIGSMLISVNPFQERPKLYGKKVIAAFRKHFASSSGLSSSTPAQASSGRDSGLSLESFPHVYALTAQAFATLLQNGVSQSILVSGESGSGKTVAAHCVLEYLAYSCANSSSSSSTTSGLSAALSSPLPPRARAVALNVSAGISLGTSGGLVSSGGLLSPGTVVAAEETKVSVDRQLLHVTPLLEAFGNAKTVLNDNSSRFGKWIKCHFQADGSGTLIGAQIEAYLLEKSRVAKISSGERSFHIFYQLCSGANEPERRALWLPAHTDGAPAAASFMMLNGHRRDGASTQPLFLDGVDDAGNFQKVRQAITLVIGAEGRRKIMSVVAAILHLSNIQLLDSDTQQATFSPTELAEGSALDHAAKLLGLSAPALARDLSSRTFTTNRAGGQGSFYKIKLSKDESYAARDALSKDLYSRLFAWLVGGINKKLCPEQPGSSPFVGVLDIFGFEVFPHNGFEQFCINFANERLQQLFTQRCVKDEQAEYAREGIIWEPFEITDNENCLDLFEARPHGILSLLDEECIVPQGNDLSLLQKLNVQHAQSECWVPLAVGTQRGRKPDDYSRFCILHFAGEVEYSVTGFLEHNRDRLHDHLAAALAESRSPFVAELFGRFPQEEATSEAQSQGVASAFPRRGGLGGAPPARGMPGRGAPRGTRGGGIGRGQVTRQPLAPAASSPSLASPASGRRDHTIVGDFRRQLQDLMGAIARTECHFVRCISPNTTKNPLVFDVGKVVHQLRCAGLLDAIRIRKSGYERRWPHETFCSKFQTLFAANQQVAPRERCRQVLAKTFANRPECRWQVGTRLVFLNSAGLEYLESASAEVLMEHALVLQRLSRAVIARRWLAALHEARQVQIKAEEEIRRQVAAATCLQAVCRALAARTALSDLYQDEIARLTEKRLALEAEEALQRKVDQEAASESPDPGIPQSSVSDLAALLALDEDEPDNERDRRMDTSMTVSQAVRYETEIATLRGILAAEREKAARLTPERSDSPPISADGGSSNWTSASASRQARDAKNKAERDERFRAARQQVEQRRSQEVGSDFIAPIVISLPSIPSNPAVSVSAEDRPAKTRRRSPSSARARSRSPSGRKKIKATLVPQCAPRHNVNKLHNAVLEGNTSRLRKALTLDKLPQTVSKALTLSDDKRTPEEVLHKCGAIGLNDLDEMDRSPLLIALREDEVEHTRLLLEAYGAAMTAVEEVAAGRSLSSKSLAAKHQPVHVPSSTRALFDINTRCFPGGNTLLHVACQSDISQHDSFQLLLAFPKLVFNVENNDGTTPLHYLAAHFKPVPDHPELTKTLFAAFVHGAARVNARNLSGETPLHRAALNKHADIDVATELVQMGANINARASRRRGGETPLHWAVRMNSELLVLFLVRQGADVSLASVEGHTAYALARDVLKIPRIASCLRTRTEATGLISLVSTGGLGRSMDTASNALLLEARRQVSGKKKSFPSGLLPDRSVPLRPDQVHPWFLEWEPVRRRLLMGFDPAVLAVPPAISEMLEFLVSNRAFESEGLFRLPGYHTEVKDIARLYRRGAHGVDLNALTTGNGVATVAGALKAWIRDCFQPLMPYELFSALEWAVKRGSKSRSGRGPHSSGSSGNVLAAPAEDGLSVTARAFQQPIPFKRQIMKKRLRSLSSVIQEFPPGNQAILGELFRFLHIVDELSEKNRMDAKNLAVIFAATLFRRGAALSDGEARPTAIDAVASALADQASCEKIVFYLIKHVYTVFDFLYEKPKTTVEPVEDLNSSVSLLDSPPIAAAGALKLPAHPAPAQPVLSPPATASTSDKDARSEQAKVEIPAPKAPFQQPNVGNASQSSEPKGRLERSNTVIESVVHRVESQPWFVDIDRANAEEMLRSYGDRSMLLVRPSSLPQHYAVSVIDCHTPARRFFVHYLVKVTQNANGSESFVLVDTGPATAAGANRSVLSDTRVYTSLAQLIGQSPILSVFSPVDATVQCDDHDDFHGYDVIELPAEF